MNFNIEHVALHLVDKKLDKPQLAKKEINISSFSQGDQDAIKQFFSGHLDQMWEAEEVGRVFVANFVRGSEIRRQYKEIASTLATDGGDPTQRFYSSSCTMAESLYEVTPGNVPAGLLMALWFRVERVRRPFLALFKMDPGRADQVVVRSLDGRLLLDLAVEHIEGALPEPKRVLKWAITPHPTQRLDMKIKDFSNQREPAKYFMTFLGCEARTSEIVQINDLFKSLPVGPVGRLADYIQSRDITDVGPDTITDAIEQTNFFSDAHKGELVQRVSTGTSSALHTSPAALQWRKIEYKLDNEITIRGPRAPIEDITIVRLGENSYEFRIRTTDYETKYLR